MIPFIIIKQYCINLNNITWIGLDSEFISFNFQNAEDFIEFNWGDRNGGVKLNHAEFCNLKDKIVKLEKK